MVSIPNADNIVTNIITNLSDNPNKSGMGSTELKNAFDEGPTNIKNYLKDLQTVLTTNFNSIYPVGSIYMSVNNVNPSTIFGGTWEQIEDKFLLASGTTYTAGTTGGEATHTLTINEMPSHRHSTYYLTNTASGSARWGMAHSNSPQKTELDNGTAYVGGGQAHNNMPPYLAVYVWKRVS